MKKIILPLIIILSITNSFAQSKRWNYELGMNYVYSAPTGSMRHNIRQGNGITMDFGLITPSKRFSLGMEMNYTQYGHDKSKQQYEFSDGTTAQMDVTVSNSFTNLMAFSRYYLLTEGSFQPYLTAKGGYSRFSTDLNIYDPDDWDHCEPVETDILQHEGTMIGSLGAGFRLDFSTMFKKMGYGRLYLDFNTNFTQGGSVHYMNTDAPSSAHHHTTTTSSRSTDVQANFINTQTMVVHQHHVGYLYSSPVQMLDFRLGIAFRVNP